jgi:uncharacterized protein YecT (DUF1311 family)
MTTQGCVSIFATAKQATLKTGVLAFMLLAGLAVRAADVCDGVSDAAKCRTEQRAALEKALATAYQAALATLPALDSEDNRKQQSQLVASQNAWKSYTTENCALLGGLEGGNNASVAQFANACELEAIAQRIKLLDGIAKP